jgi:hypothetical protein
MNTASKAHIKPDPKTRITSIRGKSNVIYIPLSRLF